MPVIGTRTVAQGYNQTDKTRTGFALTERDDATSLRHTTWRKLETQAGRWTSPDPYLGSMSLAEPQSLNRYAYVNNDPVNMVDPSGLLMSPGYWSGWDTWGSGGNSWWQGIFGIYETVTVTASYDDWEDRFGAHNGGFSGDFGIHGPREPLTPVDPDPQNPVVPDERTSGHCSGYKGENLKYDVPRKKPDSDGAKNAREHITNGHINQLPPYVGKKSKYVFGTLNRASLETRQNIVAGLNAATFNLGNGSQDGNRYVFEIDFNAFSLLPPQPYKGGQSVVGVVNTATITNRITGRNRLIVESDCQTVVSSYPF